MKSKLPTMIKLVSISLVLVTGISFSSAEAHTISGTALLAHCEISTGVQAQCLAQISDLHPTQMSVGMIEVQEKENQISALLNQPEALEKFQLKNAEPTVIGPEGQLFIIDHHHMGRALADQGVKTAVCVIFANYSNLSWADFWSKMESQNWVYPYDENGKGPLPISSLPSQVSDLKNDPYRSLAGGVRAAGGYQKSTAPFSEFLWANFFRTRIKIGPTMDEFNTAVQEGVTLAHSSEASNLPGYISK